MGINVYLGMFLAQMQVSLGSRATSILPKPLPSLLILIGLFICGYPQVNAEWMTWSHTMKQAMIPLIPGAKAPTDEVINRYWVSVGVIFLVFGIFFSRNARRVLTMPLFNFLGRVSFAVYLLHDTLIRSLMVWMVYGANVAKTDLAAKDEKGNRLNYVPKGGKVTFLIAVPVFYATLYAVAHLWTVHVDARCGQAINWMRDLMFRESEKRGPVLGRDLEKEKPLQNGNGSVAPLTSVV